MEGNRGVLPSPYTSVSKVDGGHTLIYSNKEKKELNPVKTHIQFVIYKEIVEYCIIPCVDVFLVNLKERKYFLVHRNNKPAKNMWWYIGGRVFKYESFLDCAVRKCKDETHLDVEAIEILGNKRTCFPDSEWDNDKKIVGTDTLNTYVLAILQNITQKVKVDKTSQGYKWESFENSPEDLYLLEIYKKAMEYLEKNLIESKNLLDK